MATLPDRLLPGAPYPLGATWDGLGINFAVFSANAERIELCLFDPAGRREIARLDAAGMHRRGLARLSARRARRACSTAIAPTAPTSRSTAIASTRTSCCSIPMRGAWPASCAGPMRCSAIASNSPRADLSFDRRDSAPGMPKARGDRRQLQLGRRPAARRAVVGHRDLRGACARPDACCATDLRPHERGTFAALGRSRTSSTICGGSASPRSSCCRSTPSCRTATCCEKGLRNYWGYNTHRLLRARAALSVGRHAPTRCASRCAACTPPASRSSSTSSTTTPPRATSSGPTLSFRGLDNASYYRLVPDNPRHYINDTGTGNTVNLSHPRVLQMVMDSLRYWVDVVPCRRLPLRSRRHAGPRGARLRSRLAASSTRCARTRCCRA